MDLPTAVRWAVPAVPHPDGRAYPFLNSPINVNSSSVKDGYLAYTCSDASLCCQLASLEAATAIARTLQRTLVLPQMLCPGGVIDAYFDLARLHRLVRVITVDELRAALLPAPDDVAFCRVKVDRAASPWLDGLALQASDVGGRVEAASDQTLDKLLHGGGNDAPGLSDSGAATMTLELRAPLRGACALRGHFGALPQRVLVLSSCLSIVACASILDAGERELFLMALKPCRRLLDKLRGALAALPRPCLAVRAPLSDPIEVDRVVRRSTRVQPTIWIDATSASLMEPPAPLPPLADRSPASPTAGCKQADTMATERPRYEPLDAMLSLDHESALGAEVLRVSLCALADFFVGSARSLDSELVRRLRRQGCAHFMDHVLVPAAVATAVPAMKPARQLVSDGVNSELSATATAAVFTAAAVSTAAAATTAAAEAAAVAAAAVPPTVTTTVRTSLHTPHLCCRRASLTARARFRRRCRWTSAEEGGEPMDLALGERALSVLSCSPGDSPGMVVALAAPHLWSPPAAGMSAEALLDHFVHATLPVLRTQSLDVARPGSTSRVALIVEPRCHVRLEYVVRNAALLLGRDWQIQIVHGSANAQYVHSLFSTAELAQLQLVSIGVDNLSRQVRGGACS